MGKKKILFIYPASYDSENRLIKSGCSFLPFRTLPYLAALTPERYETRIIDELVDEVHFDEDADLVALTGMVRHMPRAIDIAGEFKKRGKTVIIGGLGAFSLQNLIEKSGVFDSLIIGEVDELWKEILYDFEMKRLKSRYECANPPKLDNLPNARFDLLNKRKYIRSFVGLKDPIIPVETSRGCPHNCNFCLVSRYFGRKMRYRPIQDVVNEIKSHKAKFILFADDNIMVNPERSRELFLALKPLDIQWLGQFESSVIRYPKLLKLASECGCRDAFVGVESLNNDNLCSANKKHSAGIDFKNMANCFKEAKIDFFPSLIFGMDNDTEETIAQSIEKMIRCNVDAAIPWILTPDPKTPLYDEYKNEGRILHENYSLYDHWHVVIKPKKMTPKTLERSFWKGLRRFYSMSSILSRAFRNNKINLAWFLCSMYFRRQVKGGLHPFAGNG